MSDEAPLRVLFVVHHRMHHAAGVTGATLALGAALEQRGHRVSYFGFDDAFGSRAGADIPEMLRFPWYVARHLMRNAASYDVIDATTGDAWVWCSLGRRGGGRTALVTRSHGLEHVLVADLRRRAAIGQVRLSRKYPLYHGGFRLWEVARSLRGADAQVFLNEADCEHAVHALGVTADTTVVMPNGLPERMLVSEPSGKIAREPGIALAFIGSWIPRKGTKAVVDMARALTTRNLPFHLRLLGTGTADDIVLSSFDAKSGGHVTVVRQFAPEELPMLLQGATVLLHPSWTEGFSLGLVEGMAAGLAPVATRSGGASTVIQHERSGLLLADESGDALASAVERLAGDTVLLTRMRAAARQSVQSLRWDSIAERTVAVYREAIARRMRTTTSA